MEATILYGSKEPIVFKASHQKKMAAPMLWGSCNEENKIKFGRKWETLRKINWHTGWKGSSVTAVLEIGMVWFLKGWSRCIDWLCACASSKRLHLNTERRQSGFCEVTLRDGGELPFWGPRTPNKSENLTSRRLRRVKRMTLSSRVPGSREGL